MRMPPDGNGRDIIVVEKPADLINVFVSPRLDPMRDRKHVTVTAGATLAEIVDAELSPEIQQRSRVSVNGDLVHAEYWKQVRPKAGTFVLVRVVPGRDQILRNVLTVATTIAAYAVASAITGPGALALTGALGNIATAGIAGGLSPAVTLMSADLLNDRNR